MEQLTPSLVVREETDEEGDTYWAIVAKTYDRRTLDSLADALKLELRIITDSTR